MATVLKHIFSIVIFSLPILPYTALSQSKKGVSTIINQIYQLEQNRDPKCYATANRLEDFMYGTPLTEEARNLKIEIQKEITYYLRLESSKIAGTKEHAEIKAEDLEPVLKKLSLFEKEPSGNYVYPLTTGNILILNKDYRHYSSVAYGYRSILSVEQDFAFGGDTSLLSFDESALEKANEYLNLMTLAVLKVSDINARKQNKETIDKDLLESTWIQILNESKNTENLSSLQYPDPIATTSGNNNVMLKQLIDKKIASYEKYNQLAASVFLRNVQVYFARQKWPTDEKTSTDLKNYYLESLVKFGVALLQISQKVASESDNNFIRLPHVQKALYQFQPFSTNEFEDITFFPKSDNAITIEAYDLDAFRDSGFHWRILGYALSDLKDFKLREIDPNASELMVEGIAQMGVLVFRIAGEHSSTAQKEKLDFEDIEYAFKTIQQYIDTYNPNAEEKVQTIKSAVSKNTGNTTFSVTSTDVGINFEHRSSDWLSRLIRSYTVSYEEGKINLAIPPAFGGSGVACEDINNDGWEDILLLSGSGNKLYINTGENSFKDISEVAKINAYDEDLQSFGEPRQPIICDFNNDGLQDIFITYVNQPHKLYKNLGNSTFEDVSNNAQLGGENAVGGPATAFDYDKDGLLDIFIGYFGNYINGVLPTLSRDNQNGMPNKLFKNKGNFVFEEVTFTQDPLTNFGWTQALGHSDINQDGLQDVIVGNDFGKNKYYLNTKNGLFKEMSQSLGTDKPSYTMNVGITDLNQDLYPDFYISNIVVMQKDEKYVSPNENTQMKFDREKMTTIRTVEANDLFLSNVANNSLKNLELATNVGRGYSATGWSWDADFFDSDNDGDEDLYCLNGMNDFSVYSSENPFYFERKKDAKNITYAESNREKNVLFTNENGTLGNAENSSGLDLLSNSRSAAYLDFDNDGDLDIIINNYHDKATFLSNNNEHKNHWIKIKLIGNPKVGINRDAIGSSMVLNSSNNKNMWREVHSTTGYLSVHPKLQHFGLGEDNQVNVTVKWSNGEAFKITKPLKANASYTITYPNTVVEAE